MITKTELGWTQDAYNSFQSETGNPALEFVLEAYTLQLSNIADPTGAGDSVSTLDAIVVDDAVVRVWSDANTIYVNTLASEDAAEQAWQENTISEADLDENVPPSLATDGSDVRVFYYTGSGSIEYRESSDKGESWGAAVEVIAKASVKYIAASALTRCHYAAVTGSNNVRLGVATYSASWAADDSYIWWPFLPSSFDAVEAPQYDDAAAATNDIIVFTTDFPPLVTYRVDGTEPVKKLERVQGIALIRYQNGRWSHHHQVDTLDNVPSTTSMAAAGVRLARDNVRISRIDDLVFMTYHRRDGSDDFGHSALAVTRSRSGLHWEMPYLLSTDTTGKCAVLVSRGEHAYLVSGNNSKVRSNVTNYVGTTNISYDLSDYVLSVDMREGDAKELKVTIANPAGVLDEQLDYDTQWQMRLSMGYVADGVTTTVQTIVADLENISRTRTLPGDHRVLSGRNALGRVASLRADLVQEWESWQAGGDNFQSLDDTKYSGMRHTAPYAGHWEANSNILQLLSGEQTGIAANTQTSHAWNGSAQTSIKVASTTSDDFAGIIFRMLDKYNFWFVIYDADNDCLTLNYRRENVDVHSPSLHGKLSMGWSPDVKYWLKVNAYYNYVNVYTSTDGVSWVASFGGELPGVSEGTDFEYSLIDTMRGAMGYFGHGYSESTPTYPPPPYTPPPIDIPVPGKKGKHVVIGANLSTDAVMLYTEDIDETNPTWVEIGSTPLAATENVIMWDFDPDNPSTVIVLTNPGGGSTVGNLWKIDDYTDSSDSWYLINDGAATYAAAVTAHGGAGISASMAVASGGKVAMSNSNGNQFFCIYGTTSSCNNVGTMFVGGHGYSSLRLGTFTKTGGAFYSFCTQSFSIWKSSFVGTSSDGNVWTSLGAGVSGNAGSTLRGTDDGDTLATNWDGGPWYTFEMFSGGNPDSTTVIDSGMTLFNNYGESLIPVAGAAASEALWVEWNHPPYGAGATSLYKGAGHPTVWNTVSITEAMTSSDNWRGGDGIDPDDRIILASAHDPEDGTTGTQMIFLLEDDGTTIGNKTSDLNTTYGVVLIKRVRFDQSR